jgi:ATP-dependent helicase HepA
MSRCRGKAGERCGGPSDRGETGNAAFLVDANLPPRSAWITGVFLLECIADRKLDVERYLPPQPITITVDSKLAPRDYMPTPQAITRSDDKPVDLAKFRPILSALVPPMKKAAEARDRAGPGIDRCASANLERNSAANSNACARSSG